ncbi:MAG TPA: ABC transporter permease [Acidimicrobiales bacterium]|nr:ABC transporter permease [Acidimicrobiales bacterium]
MTVEQTDESAQSAGSAQGQASAEGIQPDARSGMQSSLLYNVERFALPSLLILVLIFFSVWPKTGSLFASAANFQETGSDYVYIGMLALASLLPLVCGEFDFSVGSNAGFTQIVAATAMARFHVPLPFAIMLAIAFGAAVGLGNGNTVSRVGVNSLIVTLGTSAILLGVVEWYTGSQSINIGISPSLVNFGSERTFGVPDMCYLLLGVALVVYYVLQHTPYGRYLSSVGSNPRAARLVGLQVDRLKLTAFVLAGALAGVAGVLLVAKNGSATPEAGSVTDTLQALAACYLGATSIRPGRFNVPGAMLAVYFIGFSVSGLAIAGVQSWVSQVFSGAALFIAVVVSTVIGRRRAGGA